MRHLHGLEIWASRGVAPRRDIHGSPVLQRCPGGKRTNYCATCVLHDSFQNGSFWNDFPIVSCSQHGSFNQKLLILTGHSKRRQAAKQWGGGAICSAEQKELSNRSKVPPIWQADADNPGQHTMLRLLCDRDTLNSHTVLIFDIRGTSPIFMRLSPIVTTVDGLSGSVTSAPS